MMILFSAERANLRPAINKVNTLTVRQFLKSKDIDFKLVEGCYQDTTEVSFQVPYSEYNLNTILVVAKHYNQESVLVLTERGVELIYIESGEVVKIGDKFKQVSEAQALLESAYTKIGETYWVVR